MFMLDYDYKLEKLDEFKKNIIRSSIYSSQNIKKYKCCPYCGNNQFIKHGRYNGIQRYRCKNKNCRKTFSNTTNSVWKYLKHEPEKWIKFIEFMGEGYSLRICARVLEISVATANNVLPIVKDNCFVHQHHARIAGGCKCVVEHNKKLPRKIKKKYGFKLYYGSMIDKIPPEEEYTPRYFTYLFTWISRFRGIATKYVDHYFNFYSLIDAEEHFDYIGIFFSLLMNCFYTSIENLKKLHLENY